MKLSAYLLSCLLCFSIVASADDRARVNFLSKSGSEFFREGSLKDADKMISEIEGAYRRKKQFAGEPLSEHKPYSQEDILEIVRIGKNAVYVRTRLNFTNGHSCSFSGVARYNEIGTFAFLRGIDENDSDEDCKIELRENSSEIQLVSANCENKWCGARGHLSGNFAQSSKRKITYTARPKKSPQYQSSIDGWNRLTREKPLTVGK